VNSHIASVFSQSHVNSRGTAPEQPVHSPKMVKQISMNFYKFYFFFKFANLNELWNRKSRILELW